MAHEMEMIDRNNASKKPPQHQNNSIMTSVRVSITTVEFIVKILLHVITFIRLLLTVGGVGFAMLKHSFIHAPNMFQCAAFVNAINILIMALLWAGVYAEKRNCLPIYILLEIPFVSFGFIGIMLNPGMTSDNHRGDEQFFTWMGIFILICLIVYVMMIAKYHHFLKRRDTARKRHLYGAIENI